MASTDTIIDVSTNVLSGHSSPEDPTVASQNGVPANTTSPASPNGARARVPAGTSTALTVWRGHSVELCQRFVEHLVAEALEQRVRINPSAVVPKVDWSIIWSAAEGARSLAEAFGRVVMVADQVAREIPTLAPPKWPAGLPGSPPGPPASDGAPPTAASVQTQPTVASPTAASVQAQPTMAPPTAPPVQAQPTMIASTTVATAHAATLERPRFESVDLVADAPVTNGSYTIPAPVLADESPVVPTPESATRRRRLFHFFGWLQNFGIILLLFAAWQLWGTGFAEHHAQQSLGAQFAAEVHSAASGPAGSSTTPSTLLAVGAHPPEPAVGSVIAHLQIPAIGVDEYVVEGSGTAQLDVGPGHYVGTALPGQSGNVAIAGHRTTHGAPFNRLGKVLPGDPIMLTTTTGQELTYVVAKPWVAVSPSDTSVLNYFGDNRITLTTCNPEFSAAQRLIVVGYLKKIGSSAAPQTTLSAGTSVPVAVEPSMTAGWNWGSLPAVVAVAVVLVLLGAFYGRLKGVLSRGGKGFVTWLVLGPIWIVGLYALFVTSTNFLPATL